MVRCLLVAWIAILLIMPAMCWGQTYPANVIPPPIPTGPPLTNVPVLPSSRPMWLEDSPDVRPAGAVAPETPAWSGATWPPAPLQGGTYESACTFGCPDPVFHAGTTTTQVLVGAYFSGGLGPSIAQFQYVPVTFRQGWILNGPGEMTLGGGSWEALADVTAASIISRYGTWMAGSSVYLRYNFADLGTALVPYHQVGAGFILTDADRDLTQRAIGQMFEFHLHYEIGFRYFVTPNLSLDLEGGLQHISNANMADRNFGVNAFGAQVGFTYYFPWGQQ
jgi:Lipid A 3-O-deacylase (PagL)